ncbi:MAG: hypothetical protein NVSMB23_25560 [Myxococcales bacterium]
MLFSAVGLLGRRKRPPTSESRTNPIAVTEKSRTLAKWKGTVTLGVERAQTERSAFLPRMDGKVYGEGEVSQAAPGRAGRNHATM